MTDTTYEVRYMRRAQIAQYEPHEGEIRAVSIFSENEQGDISVAETKLRECREAVERVLGIRAQTPAAVVSPHEGTADNGEVSSAVGTPPKRGRPSNKELAERAAKRALENANADPMAEVLEEQVEVPQISTGEERVEMETPVDPMDDMMGIPEPKPAPELEPEIERPITDQELQNEAGKAVQRLGDANIIRVMVKTNYRVARLDEVPAKTRRALVSDLRNLQKDGSIKAPEKK